MTPRRSWLVLALLVGLGGAARADALADARIFIGMQLELIKAGDVDGVRAGMTDRLRDKVTGEALAQAKQRLAGVTIDDLVAAAVAKGTAVSVKTKAGRTLTTLVQVAGKWKADTLWFK